ncbi:hypothetical protein Q0Z83_007690 [Actinoplanes sichuanensis]|uniref:Uncharacterized protein n=1 Tax=Actinoplanes sichuanensis TaxID=512349 RepID=A0ABW4AGK2_9ACTN|nr:hypothetical protein [Actinoplanes sichuanensis]BEL02578.1 hypothetical protein Q0Z83_007690 [Actinoplanes sichuanensis]
MTRPTAVQRIAVATLARLLPTGFRDRQRAEWSADLLELSRRQRVRYLLSAAWTLPELRAAVRAGRPVWWSPAGLRAGLGRPGTSGVVAMAVVAAVLGAIFGAAAATRIGWEYARPLPSGPEAAALTRTAFPGMTVTSQEDAAFWADDPDDRSVYGGVIYSVDHAGIEVPGVTQRLNAAGWQTVPHLYPDMEPSMYGTDTRMERDGLVLMYNTRSASFTVTRAVPSWMGGVAAAGAAVGALLGWLLVGWAGRRAPEGTIAGQLSSLIVWPSAFLILLWQTGAFLYREFGWTSGDAFFLQLLYLAEDLFLFSWAAGTAVVAFTVVAVLNRWPQIVQHQ